MGKIEALASLAVIGFENPEWAKPIICNGTETVFESNGIGHPLITLNRVHNDLTVDGKVKVILVTGSNMSGKSTLLKDDGYKFGPCIFWGTSMCKIL